MDSLMAVIRDDPDLNNELEKLRVPKLKASIRRSERNWRKRMSELRETEQETEETTPAAEPERAAGKEKHMPRRSNVELDELTKTPWNELTRGERRSARNRMLSRRGDAELDEKALDMLADNGHISIDRAYRNVFALRETEKAAQAGKPSAPAAEPPQPANPAEPAEPAGHAEPAGDAETAEGITWLDEWPGDPVHVSAWKDVADALRIKGRPAIIARGLARETANKLCSIIRTGRSGAWKPRGTYRSTYIQNEDGTKDVVAQYIGEN